MLPLSFVALGLVAIGAYARPLVRDVGGPANTSLSTPADKVTPVSDLRVAITVKNLNDKDLKILDPGTTDNELPTRPSVAVEDGKEVPLTGITVPVSADHLPENEWVVIPGGKNVTAGHNAPAVDGPSDTTHHTNINNDRSVSTTNGVSKRELKLEKRAEIVDCQDPNQRNGVLAATGEAKRLASIAASYIVARGANDPLYRAYFGSNPISTPIFVFNTIENKELYPAWMRCADILGTCKIKTAYIYQSNIYFCNGFFTLSVLDSLCAGNLVANRNIRGGTILHQLAIDFGVAHDIAIGCADDRRLHDAEKIKNADNYQCFAAQVYANTMCQRGLAGGGNPGGRVVSNSRDLNGPGS